MVNNSDQRIVFIVINFAIKNKKSIFALTKTKEFTAFPPDCYSSTNSSQGDYFIKIIFQTNHTTLLVVVQIRCAY